MTDFESLVTEGKTLPFQGWDFGAIRERWERGEPPWDLRSIVRARLTSDTNFVDLGTGGGEFLASLAPLPKVTIATEGYLPNLSVARARLEPLGVRVIAMRTDLRLDVPTGSIDVVHSRHEAFDPFEVARILRRGGTFITQQVGGQNYLDLHRRFGAKGEPPRNRVESLERFTEEILGAGFNVVTSEQAIFSERFHDVGAVVYFLRAAPWEVPDFSVERYRPVLERIHEEIQKAGYWELFAHRLLVVADRK